MFVNGESILGQTGAARTHLTRSGVGPGDLFLFFGLFAEEHSGERHHRLFGYLRVRTACVVSELGKEERSELAKLRHPHLIGDVRSEDVIYRGEGAVARTVLPELRLTRPGGPVSRWCVPAWLADRGLSYHGRPDRWSTAGELSVVSRGQEFVCDIAGDPVARAWAEEVVARMRA